MTRHIITIVLLLTATAAGCSPGFLSYTTTVDRFDKAAKLYEDEHYAEARTIFREIADDNFDHPIYPRAEFNDAYTSWVMKDYDRAEKRFLGLLKLDLDDLDPSGNQGIMDEPYANYKNRASLILAEICIDEGRFAEAKRYAGLADSVYPYHHFCGNELMGSLIAQRVLYSRCDEGLGDTLGALRPLLPDMFYNALASPFPLAARVIEIMKHRYSLSERREIIELALTGIHRYVMHEEWGSEDGYAIRLFDTDVYIPMILRNRARTREELERAMKRDKSPDEMREEFRLTAFYRRLLEQE
jgi:tetratricopeptide (TPR) repeat protein